ncbi:MAG: hypothetical protein NTZ35_16370 [Ignavibacteriales bacterium]|nr:hypothetical protein [Ignavibacteriales bacterium]
MEEQAPSAPTISLSDIIVNVFASPVEAYEGIRTSPSRASVWVVPLLLTFVLTIGYTWMMFTNESIKSQIVEQQRERLQEQVQAGKIPQERADQMLDGTEKGTGMMIAFGIVGAVIMISITLFVGALFLWLIGKLALKAEAGYGKYLELWGSSMWIGMLGLIVTALLLMAFNSMYASPSAALAVLSNYSPKNSLHRLLTSLNVFSIWQMIVVGIGLSKFSGKSIGIGIGSSFALWFVWVLISVFALAAMFGG